MRSRLADDEDPKGTGPLLRRNRERGRQSEGAGREELPGEPVVVAVGGTAPDGAWDGECGGVAVMQETQRALGCEKQQRRHRDRDRAGEQG